MGENLSMSRIMLITNGDIVVTLNTGLAVGKALKYSERNN